MTLKRLEHAGFSSPVQEPPDTIAGKTGKVRSEVWDYTDERGGDGNELFRTAIYLDTETNEVVFVNKGTGVRHRARNLAWYREWGETKRAQEQIEAARREKAAKDAAEADDDEDAPEPEETKPEAPAAKRAKGATRTTASGAKVTVERGLDDEDARA